MERYTVIWTYVANYGTITIEAASAEQAAERVFAGFSDDFRKHATCYVILANDLTTVKGTPNGFEYGRG